MDAAVFFAVVRRLRPTVWPFVWLHVLLGFLLAEGTDPTALPLAEWLRGLVAGGVWSVCLAGPAIALADVLSGPADADPAARAAGWAAVGLMLAGLLFAPVIGWAFLDAWLIGMVVAVLRSASPALGRLPAVSALLQAVGFGGLTLFGGLAAGGLDLARIGLAASHMTGFAFLFLAMAVLRGEGHSGGAVGAYVVLLAAAGTCLGLGEAQAGAVWYAELMALPPLAAWALLGVARYQGGGRAPGLGVCLGAWLVTDVAFILMAAAR